MRDFRPDPKPEPRIIDPEAGRAKVLLEGRCRLCDLGPWWKLSRHHLVPTGQGGDDLDCNIVPLCGHGTVGCHGLVEHSMIARSLLRPRLTLDEWAYVVGKVGLGRAEARYPATPGGAKR